MFKILIAEDEPYISKTIRRMVEDTHTGFEVVGDALNGDIALQKIETLKPDVIITDIKMPVMDGLTLVENLRSRNSDIIPVILSGYQEFDYAKKAMKLGVFDYLLKPLSPIALLNLLNEIYERLRSKRKFQQLDVLKGLISNKPYPSDYIKELFGSSSTDINYFYMLICAGSFHIYPCPYMAPSIEFWIKNDLENIVSSHFNCNFWVLDGEQRNEKVIIAAGNKEETGNIENAFRSVHRELVSRGGLVTSLFSHSDCPIESLGIAIQQSRLMLLKSVIFSKSNFICSDRPSDPEPANLPSLPGANTEKLLAIYIQNAQAEGFKQELHKILEGCDTLSYSQLTLERLLKHLISPFYNNSVYNNSDSIIKSKAMTIDAEINDLLCNSTSYNSLYDGFCIMIEDLFQMKKSKLGAYENQKEIVDKIEQYIKTNYSTPITLQSLSDAFGLVPPYLSRVYKKLKGISPIDHIISIRIEKVKELLVRDPPLTLKDIAEAIGFSDPFYMSKVFKSITGQSPSEFRSAKK